MTAASYNDLVSEFANFILDRDYVAAHHLFASWLQSVVSPDRLQQFIETELREVAAAAELEEIHYPAAYRVDENPLSYEEWYEVDARSRAYASSRRCTAEIPPEISGENYRKRLVVEFTPSEEEDLDVDAWLDFWVIVVIEDGKERIGYFEIEDPD